MVKVEVVTPAALVVFTEYGLATVNVLKVDPPSVLISHTTVEAGVLLAAAVSDMVPPSQPVRSKGWVAMVGIAAPPSPQA